MKTSDEDVIRKIIPGNTVDSSKSDSRGYMQVSLNPSEPDQIETEVVQLLQQHTAALSRYAASLTRDRTIVQDAIQEAFLRYFIERVGGRPVDNPRAWLFRVLRNYLLDCRRKDHSMSELDLESAGRVVDSQQDLEAGYVQQESLQHALSSLSPREQECIQLRLEGFGYEEIAQILGIRAGTVAALLARGLRKMRHSGFLGRGE